MYKWNRFSSLNPASINACSHGTLESSLTDTHTYTRIEKRAPCCESLNLLSAQLPWVISLVVFVLFLLVLLPFLPLLFPFLPALSRCPSLALPLLRHSPLLALPNTHMRPLSPLLPLLLLPLLQLFPLLLFTHLSHSLRSRSKRNPLFAPSSLSRSSRTPPQTSLWPTKRRISA